MSTITLTRNELDRLVAWAVKLPQDVGTITLVSEGLSEYGVSVLLKYKSEAKPTIIDLTEMDRVNGQ